MALKLSVCTTPHQDYAFSNCIYVNPDAFSKLGKGDTVQVAVSEEHSSSIKAVYLVKPLSAVAAGHVAFNGLQRSFLRFTLDQIVTLAPFTPPVRDFLFQELEFSVKSLRRGRASATHSVDCKLLSEEVLKTFKNQVLCRGQQLAHKYQGSVTLQLEVKSFEIVQVGEDDAQSAFTTRGQLLPSSSLTFTKTDAADSSLKLVGRAVKKSANQMAGVDFEKLGIGGLDKEFTKIFRRAFASRIFPPEIVAKLGTKHVRGLMLYGPPGCGKTLIARQISKVLQGDGGEASREPKIVSGPEVLNKYVGGSEEKIRELFKEAEEEQLQAGDDSELHVIIFDEIDAICKSRGSSRDGTGVGDSVVNQLLSKIDGVNSLNNILLIGMTNRLDMIDSALLRPGRFEVHIEIGLPDEAGRVQILNIHTSTMRKSDSLAESVSIPNLAKQTKNFSGAEIEGLVKSASSFAFLRHVGQGADLTRVTDIDSFKVTGEDFERALTEVRPAFGVQGEDELTLYYRNGIVNHGEAFKHLSQTIKQLAHQVETSDRTPLLSVLLSGPTGAGKSALIAKMASDSGFPFIKMVTADSMIGMSEQAKCSSIVDVFENAYKSPLSLIILDDIERLIDFVAIGPRFSNSVLQCLLVLINKPPPKAERKLMVVATTAVASLLEQMGLTSVFTVTLAIPLLETIEEVASVLSHMGVDEKETQRIAASCSRPIAVKRLLVVLEMAKGDTGVSYDSFMECLHSVGY